MSATKQKRSGPPPRPERPEDNTPLTPTSPRIPGGWPSSPARASPLPLQPKSAPPTPPVSAGLSSSLPHALSRLGLGGSSVGGAGDPPNTPVTPAAWFSSGRMRASRSQRLSVSSSSSVESSPPQQEQRIGGRTRHSRPRAATQPIQANQQRLPRHHHHHRRERRRSSATSPHSPRVTKMRGWSSSSSSASESGSVSPGRLPPRRPIDFRNRADTGPATVLRWEGVGAVVIEAPRRAISAKATGGIKLVDARRPSHRGSDASVVKDGEINVGQEREGQTEQGGRLSAPGPGLSGNARVRKTLKSKRMEALRMVGSSPAGIVDFRNKALPSTPMSVQATPNELYYPQDSSASSSPSRSPSPARTPPPTTSLPLRFPMPPTHIPGRRPLQPLSETHNLINSNGSATNPASVYPLTPVATDLGSLSVIAGLGEDSPSAQRPARSGSRPSRSGQNGRARTYTDASRSSSVSTTSIRLRGGSVVTVIPPEQTAWQRTAYVAGPIRLNNFSNLANNSNAMLPGLPDQRGKAGSVASLDAFQEAMESFPDNLATQERRASDESVLEDLVEYFEDFGFSPGTAEKDSLDCFRPDLDDEINNRSSHGSFGTGWLSPPPEKPVPALPASFPTSQSMVAKRMSAMSGGMGAVEVIEMQDVERDSLKRTPSLLSRGSRNSSERRSRLAGPNGQRTKLRRLMMSAGGIL